MFHFIHEIIYNNISAIYSYICLFVFFADARALSAPGFSFCFPLLQAILSRNSGTSEEVELMLTHVLQIIHTHSQLRSSSDATDELIDEVDTLARVGR